MRSFVNDLPCRIRLCDLVWAVTSDVLMVMYSNDQKEDYVNLWSNLQGKPDSVGTIRRRGGLFKSQETAGNIELAAVDSADPSILVMADRA
nr:hypothetical protein CFP56_33487 [Quercus suber]